jgi:GNAT superfamily N-acetyltransferase
MTWVASRRLAASTLAALDGYAERTLACPTDLARAGGIHLVAARERGLPAWHGFTLPVVGVSFASGAVIACRPDLVERLQAELGSDVRLPSLDAAAMRRLLRAVRRILPHAFTLAGDLRATDTASFVPCPTVSRAELIARDDASALHLRARFDGEVFAIRGPRERVISWAALKLKSDAVWEIAVATEADYRGRGFARDVVSAATTYVLDHGRVPIYIHDRDNSTSAFVARALGYQIYAETVLAEF